MNTQADSASALRMSLDSGSGTRVSVRHGAIRVSDADPDDRRVIQQATDVLEYASYTLGQAGCTLREAKMSANELARHLRLVLDVVETAND